mmetsp:Transcript_12247/g.29719  ORF Transcript_12247/g.29719 Transcript_12247/m.29719 type:complete len:184 (-) Transcript_12247:482-1033(-)
MSQRVGDKVCTQLYQAALDTEEQLDDEIDRLSKLKEDDLEEIRRKRLEAMKDNHRKAQAAIRNGCGKYDEIRDEKEFFEAAKNNYKMVCVFFRVGQLTSDVMTKHFETLCKRYPTTRFCCINAEKSPYLCEKLHIWMLPSIVLIKESKTEYTIRGFDELGGMDFSTERLEAILSFREMIPELN